MTHFDLHLLRHGAPETPGLMLGRTDMAPTDAGNRACVERVAGIDPTHIVSSDLRRAHDAAAMINAPRAQPHTIDRDWREIDFGDWDGMAPGAIEPVAFQRFWEDPDTYPPPNGERWTDLVSRVSAALSRIPASGTTLVVTHGGVMRAALTVLLPVDRAGAWAFDLPYAALLSFRIWPGTERTAQLIGLRA